MFRSRLPTWILYRLSSLIIVILLLVTLSSTNIGRNKKDKEQKEIVDVGSVYYFFLS